MTIAVGQVWESHGHQRVVRIVTQSEVPWVGYEKRNIKNRMCWCHLSTFERWAKTAKLIKETS